MRPPTRPAHCEAFEFIFDRFSFSPSLAQMERELILERTRAGLEAARGQGRVGGRRRQMTVGKVKAARKLLASGTPPHEVATAWASLYRWVPAFHGRKRPAMGGGPEARCRST